MQHRAMILAVKSTGVIIVKSGQQNPRSRRRDGPMPKGYASRELEDVQLRGKVNEFY